MSDDVGSGPYSGPRRTCLVEGCGEKLHSRGLCNRHYIRYRRHGNPLIVINQDQKKNVRLSDEKVTEIRRMRARGITQKAVAKHFDVDRTTISKIDTGENWVKKTA